MRGKTFTPIIFVFVCAVCLVGCKTFSKRDPRTIYVSGNGAGDYNCSGTSDQLQINEALAYAAAHPEKNTVHLKGPHTYWINDTILIGSNTTLTGDKTAVIKLIDHARWRSGKPMMRVKGPGAHDITICGFEIDGNDKNNMDDGRHGGAGYYTMINISGSREAFTRNVNIHHMYLHDNLGDAVSASRVSRVEYHDNVVHRHGHDGIQARNGDYINVYNNKFIDRINVAIRFADCNHSKAYNNDITAESGGAGIQIQHSTDGTMDDVELFGNTIYRTSNAGIFVYNARNVPKERASNVWIHNNVLYDCGRAGSGYFPGGILVVGFNNTLIENNTIDGCFGGGVLSKRVISENGVPRADLAPPEGASGFTTIVRNNIITNSKPHKTWSAAAGIWNDMPGHAYVSENNCFFRNAGGPYVGESIEKKNDLVDVDPQYADAANHDYHLKQSSPCRGRNMGAFGKARK
ncbi:right-handed parallel beta-helix repeat-containing protein [bacterium]|nr:right-handed parallel beta-helix repeat-containing protein [bacterium]